MKLSLILDIMTGCCLAYWFWIACQASINEAWRRWCANNINKLLLINVKYYVFPKWMVTLFFAIVFGLRMGWIY